MLPTDFSSILLILCAIYLGWNIGANNSANCIGTTFGAGVFSYSSYKKVVFILAIVTCIGGFLQGGDTIDTVGKGIIDTMSIDIWALIIALFSASILVTYFTKKGTPVSTTLAVLGALTAVGLISNQSVHWKTVASIFAWGFLTPVVSAILGYLAFYILGKLTNRFSLLFEQRIMSFGVIVTAVFLSYSLGANNIGNAVGVIAGRELVTIKIAAILGGLAIILGSITFSKNVCHTIGENITEIDATMALAVQLGAAGTVYFLALIGIPTSLSFAIVGGLIGVGLVKGIASVSMRTLGRILLSWLLTPFASGIIAALILLMMNFI